MINIAKHSGIYTLTAKQTIPVSLEQAWSFFSSPKNLNLITPPHMGFEITSNINAESMYQGQIISYKVFPFKGVPANWVTEITHIEDHSYFVDEQRFGPYAMWHHEHFFSSVENGTEMIDKISYKLPISMIANIFHNALVKPKLKEIFEYRKLKVEEIFGV